MRLDKVIAAYKQRMQEDMEEIRTTYCKSCKRNGDPASEECQGLLTYVGDYSVDGCRGYERRER